MVSVLALILFGSFPGGSLAQDWNETVISRSDVGGAHFVRSSDLDGDSGLDVLSASRLDDTIAWYVNRDSTFSEQRVITAEAQGAEDVHAADLDGDGDSDVLSASASDSTIAWYENALVPTGAPRLRAELPERPVLEPNYPNPFNPSTTIRYVLSEPGPVQLTVFDLAGRRVRILADRIHSAGSHTVEFHARDLASGTYLVRLTTPAGGSTRKMTLLK